MAANWGPFGAFTPLFGWYSDPPGALTGSPVSLPLPSYWPLDPVTHRDIIYAERSCKKIAAQGRFPQRTHTSIKELNVTLTLLGKQDKYVFVLKTGNGGRPELDRAPNRAHSPSAWRAGKSGVEFRSAYKARMVFMISSFAISVPP